MYERPKPKTTFFDSRKLPASKSTPKEHYLMQLIKAGDSHKLGEFLQQSTLSLGDAHIPILMLQANQDDIKKLLVDKMQQEVSLLENEKITPKLNRPEKSRLLFLYLNLSLYYHNEVKFEREWINNSYNTLKCWQELIKNCNSSEAAKFAKLGLIIGSTFLKISEPDDSIRYFENAIELEKKSNPKNKESQRRRLLHLAEHLVQIYFRVGYQCQCTHQRENALISHISAIKYNLMRLSLAQQDDHKIKAINHFNHIYEVIVKLLDELNTMDEVDLFAEEDVEGLNRTTLPKLKEQAAELSKAVAEVQIRAQAPLEKFRALLQATEHEVNKLESRCSNSEITII